MTYPNVRGQQGTLEALRASNPGRVLRGLIGPDGGQVEGTLDQAGAGAGPGAAIDSAIADHEARISALEAGEPGEGGAA